MCECRSRQRAASWAKLARHRTWTRPTEGRPRPGSRVSLRRGSVRPLGFPQLGAPELLDGADDARPQEMPAGIARLEQPLRVLRRRRLRFRPVLLEEEVG